MFTLFDLLSLFYVFIGIRSVWTLVKHWREFTDAELTPFDRRLAGELAFFVFIPVGVLFHELGHAAATYQVGGTIDWLNGGFHYALFWGYVIPRGEFSLMQDWWIALSGNLVSVVYGFLPLALLPFTKKSWIKYTILSFARIQLGWSLVGYPLITLTGIDSDWSTIYSLRTLNVSAPLFVAHVALVAGLWLFDRSRRVKRWELGLYAGADERLSELDAAITTHFDKPNKTIRVTPAHPSPQALDALLARGNFFASHGQFDLALADYRSALQVDPQNVRALYNIGQIYLMRKNFSAAEKSFRRALVREGSAIAREGGALAHAESDTQIGGRVHYGLGMCLYQRGKTPQAIAEFDQAIARVPDVPEFYYWRGLGKRQLRDNVAARNDFTRVAQMSAESNPALAQQARQMLSST